ncbi:MAG: ribose-phosphate pyrophosphokinase [Lachnospiraceae bacterium]|nr:ribose-phosphate pyrophosphokinase [Lachnospiraceae bacterium]
MIKLNGKVIELGKFPDGTLLVKEEVPTDFGGERVAELTWLFESNEELVGLIYITRHLQEHGVGKIHLKMPYIPNARQDRVKSDEDIFTLKYFAEVINSLHFASVTVLDPHSTVSEALFERIVITRPKENVEKVIAKVEKEDAPLIMFYPDEGAMKRYSSMFDRPYTFGIKKRDWATGQIQGLDVSGMTDKIQGSDILIVDDISSRGGTFLYSAKALKALGARDIYLYISHCENTILEGEVLTSGDIKRVFTTNSIFTKEHERIEVLENE